MTELETKAVKTALTHVALQKGECPGAEWLDRVAGDELPHPLVEPMAAHLAQCANCRELVSRLRKARSLIAGWEQEKIIEFHPVVGSISTSRATVEPSRRWAAASVPEVLELEGLPVGFKGRAGPSVSQPDTASMLRVSCLAGQFPSVPPPLLVISPMPHEPEQFRESFGFWVAEAKLEIPWSVVAECLKEGLLRVAVSTAS